MVSRTTANSSSSSDTELEIKIQPRSTDTHTRPTQRQGQHRHHPPQNFQPFKKWFPWLVPAIVLVNVLVFVVAMYINNCPSHSQKCVAPGVLGRFAFESTADNLLLGPSPTTLQKMGALNVTKVVEEGQTWRLASCMWLHAGVFHVAANMLSLLFVGIRLEQEFGFLRIVLLYVISGFGGSLLSSLFVRRTISVGASGALFGLLGGMLSDLLINWTIYFNKGSALFTLTLIIVINLAVGILPRVDNFAHVGGFLSGLLLGFVLLIRPQYGWVNQHCAPPGYVAKTTAKSKYRVYQLLLLAVALVLLVSGYTYGLVLLHKGVDGNDYCSWCHYFRCIPIPLWSCAECTHVEELDQLILRCLQNNKTHTYSLRDGNGTLDLQKLCPQVCG